MTEQEHIDSCDINKMVKAAARGQQVRGSKNPLQYGYDDTTMDGVSLRIEKERLEKELADGVSEETHKILPDHLKKRIKIKKAQKNDDQTTKNEPEIDPVLKLILKLLKIPCGFGPEDIGYPPCWPPIA